MYLISLQTDPIVLPYFSFLTISSLQFVKCQTIKYFSGLKMSNYAPLSQDVWTQLTLLCNQSKWALESHRMILEA